VTHIAVPYINLLREDDGAFIKIGTQEIRRQTIHNITRCGALPCGLPQMVLNVQGKPLSGSVSSPSRHDVCRSNPPGSLRIPDGTTKDPAEAGDGSGDDGGDGPDKTFGEGRDSFRRLGAVAEATNILG
jgi:hypothetical protein